MYKKISISLALGLILIVTSLLAGFASFLRVDHINVLMPAPFADSTTEIVERFNKDFHGKIKVHVTRGPMETEAMSDLAISSLILDNSPYDIILMDVTWLAKYAEAGWLVDLNQWFNKEKTEEIVTGAMIGNYYKNNLFRWPFVADMGLLYWRTDLMERPPKTPNELIEITQILQNRNKVKHGFVWQGRQYEGLSCVFLEVLKGFGGNWINGNAIGLNLPESKNAVSWLKELIDKDISPTSVTNFAEPEALQVFKSGDSALMRNWPYAWAELQKEDSAVRGKVGITTMVSLPGVKSSSTLGSWGFSIMEKSTQKDSSAKVIEYLTSVKSQEELFLNFGYTPTNIKLFKDSELIHQSEIIMDLYNALNLTVSRPQLPLYAQFSDVIQRELSAILTDKKSVNEGLSLAQKNSENILSSSAGRFQ